MLSILLKKHFKLFYSDSHGILLDYLITFSNLDKVMNNYLIFYNKKKNSILLIIANNGVFMTASFSPSKWFEPCRSLSGSYCVIVRVRVVLKRTAGDYLGR